jgi:hypothetical protein
MEKCIDEIREFLQENKLCNNGDKTEFMVIGSKHNLQKLETNSITVNKTEIKAVDKVRNLGVMFDKTMNMELQVRSMCKKAYYNIKNIAHIRKSLSKEDTKTAVHALVTPHLDYGNALLYGVNKKLLEKLQVVQNSAARLIDRRGGSRGGDGGDASPPTSQGQGGKRGKSQSIEYPDNKDLSALRLFFASNNSWWADDGPLFYLVGHSSTACCATFGPSSTLINLFQG